MGTRVAPNFANVYIGRLTYEISAHSVNFLDTTVLKDDQGNISTDVYQKPTDTHPYLHWTLAHPLHLKQSIPYSQALRLRQICSSTSTLKKRIRICRFLCSVWLCTTQSSPLNAESAYIDSRGMLADQRTWSNRPTPSGHHIHCRNC